MTPEVTHRNIGRDRPSILDLIRRPHRIFALIALIVEAVLGYVIVRSSGFVQIFTLILFFIFMLTTIILVFLFLYKEILLSYRDQEKLSKEVEKISKEKEDTIRAAHGIVKYWPSRVDALEEINTEIFNTNKEIFISGIVLSSIFPLLKNNLFIQRLAHHISTYDKLRLTVVSLNRKAKKIYDMTKQYEKNIEDLDDTCKWSMNNLRAFKKKLVDEFGDDSN